MSSGSWTSIRSRVDRLTETVRSTPSSIQRRHSASALSIANMRQRADQAAALGQRDEAVGGDRRRGSGGTSASVPRRRSPGRFASRTSAGSAARPRRARPRRAARWPAAGAIGRRRWRRGRRPRSRCAGPWPRTWRCRRAASARRSCRRAPGSSAIPIDPSTSSIRPCTGNGCWSARWTARATATAPPRRRRRPAGSRTRPRPGGPPCPTREGRAVRRMPTSRRSPSPAWWPSVSLISLKLSRSIRSSAVSSPVRRPRTIA